MEKEDEAIIQLKIQINDEAGEYEKEVKDEKNEEVHHKLQEFLEGKHEEKDKLHKEIVEMEQDSDEEYGVYNFNITQAHMSVMHKAEEKRNKKESEQNLKKMLITSTGKDDFKDQKREE